MPVLLKLLLGAPKAPDGRGFGVENSCSLKARCLFLLNLGDLLMSYILFGYNLLSI